VTLSRTRAPMFRRGLLNNYAVPRNVSLTIGVVILGIVAIVIIFGPLLAPFPGDASSDVHPARILLSPSLAHPMGTDQVGRDLLSRVLLGARISPVIAVCVVVVSAIFGSAVGIVAGYAGGIVDEIVMRIVDIFLAVPALLLALALASVLPSGPVSVGLAIMISWWPWYARLSRAETLRVRDLGFLVNGRLLGIPRLRLLSRHVLPSVITPVIVQASLDFGGVMLTAAGLSFLGLGLQDPTPDWGVMTSFGQDYLQTQWWVSIFPGAAILVTAIGFTLFGDGIRRALDPKERGRS